MNIFRLRWKNDPEVINMLTQKENELIKDLKDQEKLCIEKYTKQAAAAVDGQLKNLFTQIAQVEQGHLNTLDKITDGSPLPSFSGSQPQPTFTAVYTAASTPDKETDCYLCSDMLATEKHASHLYDTCIFEFKDENLRNALNHIQKEEQGHGKMIYDYMSTNSMY